MKSINVYIEDYINRFYCGNPTEFYFFKPLFSSQCVFRDFFSLKNFCGAIKQQDEPDL